MVIHEVPHILKGEPPLSLIEIQKRYIIKYWEVSMKTLYRGMSVLVKREIVKCVGTEPSGGRGGPRKLYTLVEKEN